MLADLLVELTSCIHHRTGDAFCLSLADHLDSRQIRTGGRKGREWGWCMDERRGRCSFGLQGGDACEDDDRCRGGRGGRLSWRKEVKESGGERGRRRDRSPVLSHLILPTVPAADSGSSLLLVSC